MAKNTDHAARWLAGMTAPQTTQNYKDGVNATTKNPMALAAQNVNGYLAGVQEAVNSGRFVAALNNTPVSVWKNACVNVGASRISAGAQAAASKVQAFFQKWTPIFANISSTIAAMPKGGLANAMARQQATYAMLKQAAGKSAS